MAKSSQPIPTSQITSSRELTPMQHGHRGELRRALRVDRSTLRWLRFGNIGAIYVLVGVFIIFWAWLPAIFPTWQTVRTILDNNAIIALMGLSVVLPLATGVFDLSIGYVMGFANVLVAWFIAHSSLPVPIAILVALLISACIGAANAVLVVAFGVDSFIATLGSGAVVGALITLVTNEQPITSGRLAGLFSDIGQATVGGVTLPVIYAVLLAIAIWWIFERTATGRRLYATGFNAEAARLAGVPTERLRVTVLLSSALIAGFAGIVMTSQVGAGSPGVGPPYLLDAYAVAFLGASQLRAGRFNSFGTLISVVLVGTAGVGLAEAGAPAWTPDMFTGAVLIAALALTGARLGGVTHLLARFTTRHRRIAEAVSEEGPTDGGERYAQHI